MTIALKITDMGWVGGAVCAVLVRDVVGGGRRVSDAPHVIFVLGKKLCI